MAYLLNRTSRTANGDKTPIELFLGKKPSLAHLRVFGSSAYVLIPKERREGKFAPHRKLAIFVGYADTSKAWRFWDPSTGKFFTAREASFFEVQRIEKVDVDELGDADEGRFEEVSDASTGTPPDKRTDQSPESPSMPVPSGDAVNAGLEEAKSRTTSDGHLESGVPVATAGGQPERATSAPVAGGDSANPVGVRKLALPLPT